MRFFYACAVVCVAGLQPQSALGQVGHQPESSPYRDLRFKQSLTPFGGYLTGGRASAGVGPSDGPLAGLRWDVNVAAPIWLFLEAAWSGLERNLIDPNEAPEDRIIGTAKQNVFLLGGGFNLVFTGRKTWRGLAPYLGAEMGLAIGGVVPEDSSGFSFNTRFQVGPMIGLKIHPSQKVHFRLEVRDVLWRLSYPDRFFQDPINAPGTPPVLDPLVKTDSEWAHHVTYFFGIGITLRR
ncbi:MAG: hypothetical protein O7I93_00200 [Gemmatimonadetes bacterium]|nr:hypothetical protein [Gemmatimonadota bacterium]